MRFSVILPIYKVEKYLAECVDSILNQSFSDYEVILVDDGSPDTSGAICDEYARKDARIKVIHKKNGGLSDARNAGFEIACGEYVVFIDSDDYVTDKDFLKKISAKIDECGSDIVLYKYSKLYEETKKMDAPAFSLDFVNGITDSDELLYELVKRDAYYGMAWIKAFKRDVAVKGGVSFEKGLLGEDMDWYFNLLLHSGSISAIDESFIAYRQREGSITSTHKIKNLTDFIYILEKWYGIIKAKDMTDTKRNALLGALAKYYSNLLIVYMRLKDKEKRKYKKRVKALSVLLNYSISSRPMQIKKYYKILGLSGTVTLLKIYDKVRK